MTVHEFLKRAANGIRKKGLGKTILQMLTDPLKECLPKNLEFFTTNHGGLPAKEIKLLRRQSIGNRRINLIGLLIPEWVCLVAVGHLANSLSPQNAFGGGHVNADVKFQTAKSMQKVASTRLWAARFQICGSTVFSRITMNYNKLRCAQAKER